MSRKRKARNSRVLIVDACVAQSAGETEYPVSSSCRKVLEEILEVCHRVSFSQDLRHEWDAHRSRFARKWLAAMVSRKKAPLPIAPNSIPLNLDNCSDRDRKAIEKDRFLLNAAIAQDGIIVTRDERFRQALESFAEGKKVSDNIRWINPLTLQPGVLEKL